MRTKIFSVLLLAMFSPLGQAMACSFCDGAKDGKGAEHMAVAIWFLFGAVMSVLGDQYDVVGHGSWSATPPARSHNRSEPRAMSAPQQRCSRDTGPREYRCQVIARCRWADAASWL